MLAGLSGRVIEIGAGNGLNFAHYPRAVSEVVAIEPERLLRQLALESALRSGVPVDVVPGAAEALPVKSEAFDAAVISLVLCSVRDLPRALGEMPQVLQRWRGAVLRARPGRWPGDEVHPARARPHGVAGAERRLSSGPRSGRRAARGRVRTGPYRRMSMPENGPKLPVSYCVLGTAWRPATEASADRR
ncbi:Class I SAM-dependent methyltransferase OS=Streptomyces alboniger OX=132473 GN=CP975_01850 PE=4 SV=1 [Streptomyces alboniger]